MKWLIYTVLVGLIPVVSRVLVWSVTQPGTISALAASDFIAFGLILHISNINEIEHLGDYDKTWKTIQNGTSILFIALYSVLFSLIMLGEGLPGVVNYKVIQVCVVFLASISLLISFSVFHRVSTIPKSEVIR